MGELCLITGASGTGVGRSLDKFIGWPKSEPATVIKLEAEMCRRAAPRLRQLFPKDADTFPSEPSLAEVFRLPEDVMRELWEETFSDLAFGKPSRLDSALQAGSVFLTLHACWYHMESQALVSGVNHEVLGQLDTRPDRVITLIDDVFDVLSRLSRDGELFDWRDFGEYETVETANGSEDVWRPWPVAGRLLKILEWREFEVRYSQAMARTLDVPHYIFAVKHPMGTFAKLLKSPPGDMTYVSHPISAPRREGLGQSSLVELIADVCTELRAAEDVVLFEPTSIDEWRFETDDLSDTLMPGLKMRWPAFAGAGDVLWDESAGSTSDQPFLETQEPVAGLDILSEEILDQIHWRDRELVSQSRNLVTIRPFAGKPVRLSGGVEMEVKLHLGFAALYGDRPPPVVYHPTEDEQRRKVESVLAVLDLASESNRPKISNWSLAAREAMTPRLLAVDFASWLDANEVSSHLGRLFDSLESGPGLKPGATPRFQVIGGGTLSSGNRRTMRAQFARDIAAQVIQALRGELEEQRFVPLGPLEDSVIVEGNYANGAQLGKALVSKLRELRSSMPDA